MPKDDLAEHVEALGDIQRQLAESETTAFAAYIVGMAVRDLKEKMRAAAFSNDNQQGR